MPASPRAGVAAAAVLGLTLLAGCADDPAPATSPSESPSESPSTAAATSESVTESSLPAPDSSEDPVSITTYVADFKVSRNDGVAVVESLTLDVPVNDRHGVIRAFDGTTIVDGLTATLDGATTPVLPSSDAAGVSFRIGDPDRSLSVGEHVVGISYHATGSPSARPGAFDWVLVPDQWEMRIGSADLAVRLPGAASDAECAVSDGRPCVVTGQGSKTLRIHVDDLGSQTSVQLTASYE